MHAHNHVPIGYVSMLSTKANRKIQNKELTSKTHQPPSLPSPPLPPLPPSLPPLPPSHPPITPSPNLPPSPPLPSSLPPLPPSPPSLLHFPLLPLPTSLVTQQIYCPFQPKQSPSYKPIIASSGWDSSGNPRGMWLVYWSLNVRYPFMLTCAQTLRPLAQCQVRFTVKVWGSSTQRLIGQNRARGNETGRERERDKRRETDGSRQSWGERNRDKVRENKQHREIARESERKLEGERAREREW